jgi:hypothetical protein
MPEQLRNAIDEWKTADHLAREAELELKAAWDAVFEKRELRVPPALVELVASRRAEANQRLEVVMRAMRAPGPQRLSD